MNPIRQQQIGQIPYLSPEQMAINQQIKFDSYNLDKNSPDYINQQNQKIAEEAAQKKAYDDWYALQNQQSFANPLSGNEGLTPEQIASGAAWRTANPAPYNPSSRFITTNQQPTQTPNQNYQYNPMGRPSNGVATHDLINNQPTANPNQYSGSIGQPQQTYTGSSFGSRKPQMRSPRQSQLSALSTLSGNAFTRYK